jgi:hypothetical protein
MITLVGSQSLPLRLSLMVAPARLTARLASSRSQEVLQELAKSPGDLPIAHPFVEGVGVASLISTGQFHLITLELGCKRLDALDQSATDTLPTLIIPDDERGEATPASILLEELDNVERNHSNNVPIDFRNEGPVIRFLLELPKACSNLAGVIRVSKLTQKLGQCGRVIFCDLADG